MALNHVMCANSIVDALLQGRDIPSDMKEDAKKTWERIVQQIFTHIINNMEINVSIPSIPPGNFDAEVTVGGTPYPVVFNNSVPIPDETVSIS